MRIGSGQSSFDVDRLRVALEGIEAHFAGVFGAALDAAKQGATGAAKPTVSIYPHSVSTSAQGTEIAAQRSTTILGVAQIRHPWIGLIAQHRHDISAALIYAIAASDTVEVAGFVGDYDNEDDAHSGGLFSILSSNILIGVGANGSDTLVQCEWRLVLTLDTAALTETGT